MEINATTAAFAGIIGAAGGWVLKAWKINNDHSDHTLAGAFRLIETLQQHIDRTAEMISEYRQECERDRIQHNKQIKALRQQVGEIQTQITGEHYGIEESRKTEL